MLAHRQIPSWKTRVTTGERSRHDSNSDEVQTGWLKVENKQENECSCHPGISHSVDRCPEFKRILQDLIDRHILQIYRQEKKGEVCMQTGEEKTLSGPKQVVIRFTKALHLSQERQPIVIQAPSPFLYKNEKAVPWKYDAQILKGEEERKEADKTPTIVNTAIDNISSIGGMTRSGRVFTPPELRNEENQGKKTREEIATEQARAFLKGKTPQTEQDVEKSGKKEICYEEAGEFLKFIQQSEYKVVDQLNRMPARISLLELLTHSGTHRKRLMKILSGAHVEHGLSLDKFEGIVSHIMANDYLTFTEEEIPIKGRGHNKALHISVKCMDYVLARVLIDNDSSLNVMPKATLDKLPRERSHMHPSSMIVRAFDGSRREVIGEIEFPIQVGPCTSSIPNAGATYQRAMVTLFHDIMHKEIEVYVDDMIAKSRSEEEHLFNLKKLFEWLRKYELRLNPAKCTFRVKSGKLLGFIVSQKGIEVDPDKVRAVLEMPHPQTEKEFRGFLGRLNYIAKFISQLTAICKPISGCCAKTKLCNRMKTVKKLLTKSSSIYESPQYCVRQLLVDLLFYI